MRERSKALRFPINGEEIVVPGAAHLRCPKCHEVVLRMDQTRRLRERALAAYRSRYHLLSADEIRSIRERHHLTQAQIARLLRLGANTISRWESGRNVQTAAMDVLLRLIRDIPESLRYLPDGHDVLLRRPRGQREDPPVGLAAIGEGLALPEFELEQPLPVTRLPEPDRPAFAVVENVRGLVDDVDGQVTLELLAPAAHRPFRTAFDPGSRLVVSCLLSLSPSRLQSL